MEWLKLNHPYSLKKMIPINILTDTRGNNPRQRGTEVILLGPKPTVQNSKQIPTSKVGATT